jgi:hypothetical protein
MTDNMPRPVGFGIVMQALAEIEVIAKKIKRISEQLGAGCIDLFALREDLPAIHRALGNVAKDVRGLGRLLEGPCRLRRFWETTAPTVNHIDETETRSRIVASLTRIISGLIEEGFSGSLELRFEHGVLILRKTIRGSAARNS